MLLGFRQFVDSIGSFDTPKKQADVLSGCHIHATIYLLISTFKEQAGILFSKGIISSMVDVHGLFVLGAYFLSYKILCALAVAITIFGTMV